VGKKYGGFVSGVYDFMVWKMQVSLILIYTKVHNAHLIILLNRVSFRIKKNVQRTVHLDRVKIIENSEEGEKDKKVKWFYCENE